VGDIHAFKKSYLTGKLSQCYELKMAGEKVVIRLSWVTLLMGISYLQKIDALSGDSIDDDDFNGIDDDFYGM